MKKGLWILKSTDPNTIENLYYYEFEDYEEWLIDEIKRRQEEKKDSEKYDSNKYFKEAKRMSKMSAPKPPKIKMPKF